MPEQIFSRDLGSGTVIFRQGDEGDDAYIVESGDVEISLDIDGEKTIIANLGPGEIFGEMALIDDSVRSATAMAVEDTELLVLKRDRLMRPIEAADPIMRLMLKMIVDRLRDVPRWLSNQKILPREVSESRQRAFEEVRELALRRIQVEQEMRRALEVPELELYYQPIISLEDGHIGGYEALMRWNHPERGFVSPGEFIPLAEETGMIIELGRWALEDGLRGQKRLSDAYAKTHPDAPLPFVSINVSGRQLFDLEEIDLLGGIIDASDVDPAGVKLEITESLMVRDPEHAAKALARLKETGVSLAIDDFGTDYSSLSYLHRFPLDTLKIDRSFVVNMMEDQTSRRIVNAIIRMAQDLDLDIVAEGIEGREEYDLLAKYGCQYGQGYLMARPSPISEIEELILSGQTW